MNTLCGSPMCSRKKISPFLLLRKYRWVGHLKVFIINLNIKHNVNVLMFLKNTLHNTNFNKVNHLKFLCHLSFMLTKQQSLKACKVSGFKTKFNSGNFNGYWEDKWKEIQKTMSGSYFPFLQT